MPEPLPLPTPDGARRPPDARGRRAPAGPPHPAAGAWQYRELVIPLHLTSRLGPLERRARFDRLVLAALQVAARGGWAADEPTDWELLRGAGRFTVRHERGLLRSTRTWESVTIRLRRPAPGSPRP